MEIAGCVGVYSHPIGQEEVSSVRSNGDEVKTLLTWMRKELPTSDWRGLRSWQEPQIGQSVSTAWTLLENILPFSDRDFSVFTSVVKCLRNQTIFATE